MSEELAWTVVVVAAALVGIGLLFTAGLVYLIVWFRPRLLAIGAAIGAVLYGLSPIDAVPEAFVGPAGTIDDLAVWAVAGYAMYREVRRRLAEEAGRDADPGRPGAGPSSTGPGTTAGSGASTGRATGDPGDRSTGGPGGRTSGRAGRGRGCWAAPGRRLGGPGAGSGRVVVGEVVETDSPAGPDNSEPGRSAGGRTAGRP